MAIVIGAAAIGAIVFGLSRGPGRVSSVDEVANDLTAIRSELDRSTVKDPHTVPATEMRNTLADIVRRQHPAELRVEAAELLCEMAWPTYEESRPEQRWWNRRPWPR